MGPEYEILSPLGSALAEMSRRSCGHAHQRASFHSEYEAPTTICTNYTGLGEKTRPPNSLKAIFGNMRFTDSVN